MEGKKKGYKRGLSNNWWEKKSADVASIEYHLFSATDIDKFGDWEVAVSKDFYN